MATAREWKARTRIFSIATLIASLCTAISLFVWSVQVAPASLSSNLTNIAAEARYAEEARRRQVKETGANESGMFNDTATISENNDTATMSEGYDSSMMGENSSGFSIPPALPDTNQVRPETPLPVPPLGSPPDPRPPEAPKAEQSNSATIALAALIVSIFSCAITGVGTCSTMLLGWRAERRSLEERALTAQKALDLEKARQARGDADRAP